MKRKLDESEGIDQNIAQLVSSTELTLNKKRKLSCADEENNAHHADENHTEIVAENESKTNNGSGLVSTGDFSKQNIECPSFDNKVIMAPMVRIGTFPMRLLALQYGADLVYNQELIDHKVIRFERRRNEKFKCVDFINSQNKKLEFRTFPREPVIFQIGSCDAVRCLKATTRLENDILGMDLNCGCPKKFSVAGGMGAALLHKPEVVEDIIKTLKRNVRSTLSLTCKIRLLEDEKATLELCRRLQSLDINALCIHARYTADRPSSVARVAKIKTITDCLHIPCIYNGDVYKYSDIATAKTLTGCSSVMIARGAQWNMSVFDKSDTLQPLDTIIEQYIDISAKYENLFPNSKYTMVKMVTGRRWLCKHAATVAFQKVKNWNDCYAANKLLSAALSQKQEKHLETKMDESLYTDPSVFTTI